MTAERRGADIQSVPLSVVALTDDDIRSLSLRDSLDLPSAVPGLQFDQQGMGATPFIRGVGAMSGAIGNEAPVSMYVDGVYYATPNASVFTLDGIRQVEVLKGPQGTLFGRNATGGVIQVMTREPEFDPSAELELQYASDATVRGSLYATGRVGDFTAASIALNGRDQRTGWGTNLATGESTFRHNENGARGKLLWTPASQTRLLLGASHYRRRGEDGIGFHVVPGSLGVDGRTEYSGFYNSWTAPQDRARYRHTVASARLEHDFRAFGLVNILSWQEMTGWFNLDQDATPLRIVNAPISQYGRTITEELQAVSPRDSRLVWIAGLYYLHDVSAYEPLALEGAAMGEMDAADLKFADESFDIVYAPYLISVVSDPVAVAREMRRVCRTGGRIVVLNHFRSANPLAAQIERIISPFTVHFGFKSDLDLPAFLAQAELKPVSIEKVNVPRIWSLVTCVKD